MGERLTGKIAVVTGSGRNIGRAEALALAGEGASILVNDKDADVAQETAELIRAAGGKAVVKIANVSSWAGGEAVIAAALEAFGRIDILINNAGCACPRPIWEMSEENWDEVSDTSLKGYAATIRFAAPHFMAQRSGVIVNTGSTSGLGHMHMANYSGAKEGAAGLTRTVARDLGQYGVRCNLVRPISHETTMVMPEMMRSFEESTKLGLPINGDREMRLGFTALPQHVAALVLLLCLPETAHVSGQEFYMEGEEVARVRGPERIRSQFRAGGWTLEGLQEPTVLSDLLRGIPNDLLR